MATTPSALQRCMASVTCEVDKFCCCSLRAGVLIASILYLTNAALAFAGEAALFLGLLNALSAGLPPGTKLDDPRLHGGLIAIGLYMLTGSILGLISACRRNVRAATGFYVLSYIDVVLAGLVGLISWFAGAPFNAMLAQLPALALNIYMVIVVRSWRNQLLREQKGGSNGSVPLPPPGAPGVSVLGDDGDGDDLDVDVDDLALDLEAPPPRQTATVSAAGGAGGAAAAGRAKEEGTAGAGGGRGGRAAAMGGGGAAAPTSPARPVKAAGDED